ncbi:MAG: hypothetical protein JO219_07355 [Candidatus Eremiobacteraeota bacterium]|nr:hypothetical protein [Candidatus Eremiobacteraeota bacterium]MBV8367113.1 hypothetical protein [Candidatus Eremiobacteraeota bacterium]
MRHYHPLAISLAAALLASCGTPPPPAQGPVKVSVHTDVGPPPAVSTPVPIVVAKSNPNAGRSDPFAVLVSNTARVVPQRVATNRFPRIPTLPGFEGAPNGSKGASVWDGVRVSGIVQANGYSAIIEADGKSYVARQGDSIAGKFRVVAIGPGFVTLSSAEGVRNFSLGG